MDFQAALCRRGIPDGHFSLFPDIEMAEQRGQPFGFNLNAEHGGVNRKRKDSRNRQPFHLPGCSDLAGCDKWIRETVETCCALGHFINTYRYRIPCKGAAAHSLFLFDGLRILTDKEKTEILLLTISRTRNPLFSPCTC